MIRLELKSLADTKRLGRCIARLLEPGDVILFHGDLGAGKTTLTRFIAKNLGIQEREVTSPTFNIIHEHLGGKIPLIHVDLYRLGQNADILDTGIEEYLAGESVIVVEWAENLTEPIFDEYLELEITMGDDSRTAVLKPAGPAWEKKITAMKTCLEKGDGKE